jgi:hypothetical protein
MAAELTESAFSVRFRVAMPLLIRCSLALLLSACSFPSYSFAPDAGSGPKQSDPCATQKLTGKACGGQCALCALGDNCEMAADCATGVCTASVCSDPVVATCDDGRQDGTESDVDCGGTCTQCAVNRRCNIGIDCASLVCQSVCQPPTCSDGVRNGNESDKDCGGSCSPCSVGAACNMGADCSTVSCSGGHCIAATCMDGIKNGTESDVDCGGLCSPCAPNATCGKASDCQSLVCTHARCAVATCSDGVKNGTESDVDCGQGCSACLAGQTCNSGADCATGVCTHGYCVPTSPTGGMLATRTWSATASDSFNANSAGLALDGNNATRWTTGMPQVPGMWFEVDMLQPQIFFGVDLDTQDTPGDAPALFDVYFSMDGTFSTAAMKSIAGTALTQVTFTNAQVARYIKLVLTNNTSAWWSIRELTVTD